MRHVGLEICTGDPEGIRAAVSGGADRIELCSGLAEGGLTPSIAAVRFAVPLVTTNVLIRPRAGDFVYSGDELAVMEADIRECVAAGAAGIVTGVLTAGGRVDKAACRRLLEAASGLENTFHRAFDLVADPFEALEDIISLGFSRILTSGCAATAELGAGMIAGLRRRAAGRILIMAGAGITPENAAGVLAASGADELHASARRRVAGAMKCSGSASMGAADATDGSRLATDAATVEAIRKAIDSIQP